MTALNAHTEDAAGDTNQAQFLAPRTHQTASGGKRAVGNQELKSFRIEASIRNPDNFTGPERGNLYDARATVDRSKAIDHARDFWRRGYWVTVFDNETHEHLAGPLDPDAALPPYIV